LGLHIPYLSAEEKEVFKTVREIDQFELVKQAADRTPFICQAQSLNLFVDPNISAEELVKLHLSAWANGVKSLYYLRSTSLVARESLTEYKIVTKPDCPWCVKLKEQLEKDGISYTEIDRSDVDNFSYETVPQLWIGSYHVGGYSEYMKQYHSNTDSKEKYSDCEACSG
jgi:ribonucleotide reductase alpha subunit